MLFGFNPQCWKKKNKMSEKDLMDFDILYTWVQVLTLPQGLTLACGLTSLSLSFPIYKMNRIVVPVSQGSERPRRQ